MRKPVRKVGHSFTPGHDVMTRITTLLLGLCLAATSFGAAADDTDGPSLSEIREQQLQLREEVEAAEGIFEDLSGPERAELAGQQTRLLAMIEGKDHLSELDDQRQVDAFNLLQEINATINDVRGEQVKCEYVRRVGSHRKTKVCKTMAQRERERMEAERDLQRARNGFCGSQRCPGG